MLSEKRANQTLSHDFMLPDLSNMSKQKQNFHIEEMPISLYEVDEGKGNQGEVKRTTELDTQNSPRQQVNYQATVGMEIGDLVHCKFERADKFDNVPVPYTDDTNADEEECVVPKQHAKDWMKENQFGTTHDKFASFDRCKEVTAVLANSIGEEPEEPAEIILSKLM